VHSGGAKQRGASPKLRAANSFAQAGAFLGILGDFLYQNGTYEP
jgi:hypothetical protein